MVASLARPVSKLLEQLIVANQQDAPKIVASIVSKTPQNDLKKTLQKVIEVERAKERGETVAFPTGREFTGEAPLPTSDVIPGSPREARQFTAAGIVRQGDPKAGPETMTEAGGPVTSPLDEAVRARQDYEGRSSLIPGFDPAIAGTVIEEGPSAGHVRGGRTLSRVETEQGIDKRVAKIMEDNPATTIEEAESIAIQQMEADAAAKGIVPSFAGATLEARTKDQALRTQKSARRAGSAVTQPFDEPPLATRINEAELPVSRAEGENIPEAFTGRGVQSANIQTRDPITPSEAKSGKGIERIAPGVGGQELGPTNIRELRREMRAANLDRPGEEFGGPTATDFGADTMHLVDEPEVGRGISKYSRTGLGQIETEFGAETSPELVSRISRGQNIDDITRIRALKRDVEALRRRGESEEAAREIMEPKVAAAIGYREVNATIQNFYRDWKAFVNGLPKELREKHNKFFESFLKMMDTTAAVSRKEGRLDAVRTIKGKAQPTMQSLMDRFYATVQGRDEFNTFASGGQGEMFPRNPPKLASAMGERIGPEGIAARALESGARDRPQLRQQAAGIGELEPRTMYPETLRSAAGKFSPLKQALINRLSQQQRFGIPSSGPMPFPQGRAPRHYKERTPADLAVVNRLGAGKRLESEGPDLSQEDVVTQGLLEALGMILQRKR
jgi:hypothetical protein